MGNDCVVFKIAYLGRLLNTVPLSVISSLGITYSKNIFLHLLITVTDCKFLRFLMAANLELYYLLIIDFCNLELYINYVLPINNRIHTIQISLLQGSCGTGYLTASSLVFWLQKAKHVGHLGTLYLLFYFFISLLVFFTKQGLNGTFFSNFQLQNVLDG